MRQSILFGVLSITLGSSAVFGSKDEALVKNKVPVLAICTSTNPNVASKDFPAKGSTKWITDADIGKNFCENMMLDQNRDRITIRTRGNFSNRFPKKPYSITLTDENGAPRKSSFGQMKEAKKWVLRSPFVDRSYLRDLLAFQIARKLSSTTGTYLGVSSRLVEVVLNNDYAGIYLLTEQVEKGKNRVPVGKFDANADKVSSFLLQITTREHNFKTKLGTRIKFEEPSDKKIAELKSSNPKRYSEIKNSIIAELNHFEQSLANSSLSIDQIPFHALSFVDYFIMQELTKNVDGYRRSAYFYKDENQKFHMGPVWDFDLAWGNLNIYGMGKTTGWSYNRHWLVHPSSHWFKWLLKNEAFVKLVKERYFSLRKAGQPLDFDVIFQDIRSISQNIYASAERDHQRWERSYNFIHHFVTNTKSRSTRFDKNIYTLERWVQKRLKWLDGAIENL